MSLISMQKSALMKKVYSVCEYTTSSFDNVVAVGSESCRFVISHTELFRSRAVTNEYIALLIVLCSNNAGDMQ